MVAIEQFIKIPNADAILKDWKCFESSKIFLSRFGIHKFELEIRIFNEKWRRISRHSISFALHCFCETHQSLHFVDDLIKSLSIKKEKKKWHSFVKSDVLAEVLVLSHGINTSKMRWIAMFHGRFQHFNQMSWCWLTLESSLWRAVKPDNVPHRQTHTHTPSCESSNDKLVFAHGKFIDII